MTCQTCGNENQENFCPNCGEKRYDPHSLTIKHVAEETFEGFTHADHTFLRTIKTILFKPGMLSDEYVSGRRVHFMKPLGLFLVVNLLYFLLARLNVFNQPLETFLRFDNYRTFGTQETVEAALLRTHKSLPELTSQFNTAMTASSKTYLIILIPLYAVIFALLMWRMKRSFIEHLVFAAHYISFMLLFFLIYAFLFQWPLMYLAGDESWQNGGDIWSSVIGLIVLGVYLALAFRKFYGTRPLWSNVAAMISSLLFVAVVMAFRMILFYKIITLIH